MIELLVDENLYYVGGVVRDEILGINSVDTDFCYEGDAIAFAKESGLDIIKENPAFGTIRVRIGNKEIDIASTRTETYPRKGHLPKVENIGCALEKDLQRRDFAINAMAKRTTDGELVDYFNGREDLKNKIIRVLHSNSFIDDPTRIIRALKFAVRFNFELSVETRELQDEYLNNINYDMSFHRIKKELVETFSLNSAEAFDKFKELKIYKLLGEDVELPKITGVNIKNSVSNVSSENIWLIYAAPFLVNQSSINIPLTRNEKRILEWVNRLSTQAETNNTPHESIIIKELLDNA